MKKEPVKSLSGNFSFRKEVENGRITDERPTLPGFEREPVKQHKSTKKGAKK